MNKSLAIFASFVMTCLTASSQTVRDLRITDLLNAKIDTNTIAVAYSQIMAAVQLGVRFGELDSESLERAIRVGQDLHLVQTSTNGWVVGISNIVEAQQAHVPGVLFVGGVIYGAPEDGGHILLDGCDFYYNRAIPGSSDPEAGLGNLVTDPYLDWRLASFYQQWGATNAAMWAALMEINNLPASLAADLQAYNSAAGQIAQDIAAINATNEVIRAVIENAISQASGGGGGQSWTTSSTSATTINCADHCITICDRYYDEGDWESNEFTITMPTSTGTAHSMVVFMNAYDFGEYGGQIQYSCDGAAYYDDSAWGFQRQIPYWNSEYQYMDNTYMSYSVVLIDIQEIGDDNWVVSWRGFN